MPAHCRKKVVRLQADNIKYLLLVGGFGESPYLRAQLHAEFGEQGIEVFTVREPSSVHVPRSWPVILTFVQYQQKGSCVR